MTVRIHQKMFKVMWNLSVFEQERCPRTAYNETGSGRRIECIMSNLSEVVIPDTEDRDEFFNCFSNERWIRCPACNNYDKENSDHICVKCGERL